MTDKNKRRFLKGSGVMLGAIVTGLPSWAEETLPLTKTPPDAEGPFYPKGERSQDTANLLRHMTEVHGETLQFTGAIVDVQGQPLSGLTVDMWQADPMGRYDHPFDRKEGERYAGFAYWGKAVSDAAGRFEFNTYVPGDYGFRPAHIHYIIWEGDKKRLTSQIYFKGFDTRGGAIIANPRHDLREARLRRGDTTDFKTDFRVVI